VKKDENEHCIVILPEYQNGLYRLDLISHAFILWWFSENDLSELRKTEILVPGVIDSYEPPQEMGTFATRSPQRPNPIGLTLVKIIKIDGLKVVVDHIDAYNGTPVIDIKPYLPNGDRVDEQVTLPPWFEHLQGSRLPDRKDS
jgi:tRNA-Thr(GGU) m(6)t(6)A37 methyltransferase TsaA